MNQLPHKLPAPPKVSGRAIKELAAGLMPTTSARLTKVVRTWAGIKRAGGKVVVATGSGPHLHEGVTCLIAQLVQMGLVDGVLTSSAVVSHEMAGCLERVRRVDGKKMGLPPEVLPADGRVEVALLAPRAFDQIAAQTKLDRDLYRRMISAPGREIIKVAGNLAYPTGLWAETLAARMLPAAQKAGVALEAAMGPGADPLTMLGACARQKVPLLVTVPQLVGGGRVGLAIGDSIPISRRSKLVARLLGSADLIIESGIALAQEIHDGPFELHTGHGLWAWHGGQDTYSLARKKVVRIDLDPQIETAWQAQQSAGAVSEHIEKGRPKAKGLGLPFRMEMSGFCRIAGALPLIADLGALWPVLAARTSAALGVKPAFMCYKQGTPLGEKIRGYIVDNLLPLNPSLAEQALGKGGLRS